jgi:hypothetical protein
MTTYENVVKPLEDTYLILQSRTAVKAGISYTWTLNSPIVINENAYLSVVERYYESFTTSANGALPYVIRLVPNSSSIVHPVNATPATAVNAGCIIDIGYDHEPASRVIEVKLPSQQTINQITIELTRTLSGNAVIASVPEFLIIVKIIEREPRNLNYGTLNNITQRSRL